MIAARKHAWELLLYCAILVLGTGLFIHMDAYESFMVFSRSHEGWELDEMAMMLPAVLICLVIFSLNRMRELRRRARLLEESRRQLAVAHEELRALADSKEEFLTTACHELKSPLVGIVDALQLIELTRDPVERQELVGLAEASARRLGVLVENVLEYSRQDSLGPARNRFSPEALLESVREIAAPLTLNQGVALCVDLDRDVPGAVLGAENALRLIALNLVGNAMKHTEAGEVRVGLEDRTEPEALVLTVADSGSGIAAEDLPTIFEPFRQGAYGNPPKVSGLGIGLSIVKRSVEFNRGTISVESSLGRGSRFIVTLPVESLPQE
jgi:signal transduction histidine kinase